MPFQPNDISNNIQPAGHKTVPIRKPQIHQFLLFRYAIFRRWLFLISALGLCVLGWSSWLYLRHPSSGITWSYTSGIVIDVDGNYPAALMIRPGDRIVAVDGVPVYQARNLPGRQAGETVVFTVEREGRENEIPVELYQAPGWEKMINLAVIPISLSFWLLGTIVLAFGRSEKSVYLFFLFCQSTSILLSLGSISSLSPTWSWWLFGLLMWWIGPITLHTHLALPTGRESKYQTKIIRAIYLFALLLTVVDAIRLQREIAGPLLTFKYLWVGLFLLASAGFLFLTSISGGAADQRHKTRIAAVSAMTAAMPFIFLSLIPDAVSGQFILPYEVTFLALPILPLGYSYAILLHRLVQVEREISQSAAYALAVFIIVTFYAFLYLLLWHQFFNQETAFSVWELSAILIMAFAAHPINQGLRRWLYLMFYGDWFDDQAAVKRIIQDLNHMKGDTTSIAHALCETLRRTMRLNYVNLLMSNGQLFINQAELVQINEETAYSPDFVTTLFTYLQDRTGRELGSGHELSDILQELQVEDGWISGRMPQLWLLFGGSSNWQGLLILGSKHGRAEFSTKDLEILQVVVRQAGAALENERLLEEVRQRSNQIRELNRQVMWTREVERKRISRDLHDLVIQGLIGINFQLSNVRARFEPEAGDELSHIRKNLQNSVVELRSICADLRPPALDALGLIAALEARITEISSQVPFKIAFHCASLAGHEFSDEVNLCVYRFVQEGLLNVQKHSQAHKANINLWIEDDQWLNIHISDDGQGFTPPANLEMLIPQQHYGLVGLQEQVEAVGGSMFIKSIRGEGCLLIARISIHSSLVITPPGLSGIENKEIDR